MPPKNKINGYSLFVNELKSKGIFKRSMSAPQAFSEAKNLWEALSQEEQKIYKDKAIQLKNGGRGPVSNLPMISRGSSFGFGPGPNYHSGPTADANLCYRTRPQVETAPKLYPTIPATDEDYKIEINSEIFGLKMEKEKDLLITKKFLFGYFTNYIETETTPVVYYPAECSFIEFSIKEGIGKTFHTPIFPGDLPDGYLLELRNNVKEYGLIPLDLVKSKGASTCFVEVCNKIQEMMDDCSDSGNIIFTGQEEMKKMEGCIRFIFEKAKGEGRSRLRKDLIMTSCEVKVLPVEVLVQVLMHEFGYLLKSKVKGGFKEEEKKMSLLPISESKKLLNSTAMSVERPLGCENHDSEKCHIGLPYCALGNVKRWILKILEQINYPMIQHVYKLGHEKDNQHFLDLHIHAVKKFRMDKFEEAKKKKLIEIREREENERLKKIQEENQQVSLGFADRYSYILGDDGDEQETYPVMGRGRGQDFRFSLQNDNGYEKEVDMGIGRGRGRGRGNGNKYFCGSYQ